MSGQSGLVIERCGPGLVEEWLVLRQALWPHRSAEYHRRQVEDALRSQERHAGLLARVQAASVGFAEAVLRFDTVNGCSSCPVGFLEGVYVQPAWRQRGVARGLCRAVEAWAAGLGCQEVASDRALADEDARRWHQALGFEETERVVFYRKAVRRRP